MPARGWLGSPRAARPPSANPFRCEKWFTGSGNTSEPHWKITVNPVQVIDAADSANVSRAAQLIQDNCQIFDTPSCNWTRTQKSSAFLQDRKDLAVTHQLRRFVPALQHGMLQVAGDFLIITNGGERFLVKNAVFQFPLQREVQVDGRGQPVPRGNVVHVDIPCSEKPQALGAPPPAHAVTGLATFEKW